MSWWAGASEWLRIALARPRQPTVHLDLKDLKENQECLENPESVDLMDVLDLTVSL